MGISGEDRQGGERNQRAGLEHVSRRLDVIAQRAVNLHVVCGGSGGVRGTGPGTVPGLGAKKRLEAISLRDFSSVSLFKMVRARPRFRVMESCCRQKNFVSGRRPGFRKFVV